MSLYYLWNRWLGILDNISANRLYIPLICYVRPSIVTLIHVGEVMSEGHDPTESSLSTHLVKMSSLEENLSLKFERNGKENDIFFKYFAISYINVYVFL